MTSERGKVLLANDHAAVELHAACKKMLEAWGYDVVDLGTDSHDSVDYPDFAVKVAERVAAGEGRGLLLCGSGIGMDMAANKIPGVRAACVCEPYSARMSRAHNDANVLCLGSRVIGTGLVEEILKVWLETPFEGGRHQRRVDKLNALDKRRGR